MIAGDIKYSYCDSSGKDVKADPRLLVGIKDSDISVEEFLSFSGLNLDESEATVFLNITKDIMSDVFILHNSIRKTLILTYASFLGWRAWAGRHVSDTSIGGNGVKNSLSISNTFKQDALELTLMAEMNNSDGRRHTVPCDSQSELQKLKAHLSGVGHNVRMGGVL